MNSLYKKWIFLALTAVAACLLLGPALNFQLMVATGDHGRDLYCFQKTLEGQLPYKDYWWVYGPLMPYYYAGFYKIFGIGIQSILLGKSILMATATAYIFLILSLLISPVLAFIGAMWYLNFTPDFFYTYSHIGGFTCMLIVLYKALQYLHTKDKKYLYQGLFFNLLLCLIKINFGLSVLVCLIFTVLLSDRVFKTPSSKSNNKFYWGIFLTLGITFLVYYLLLKDLPFYEVRQCLPYFKSDHPHNMSPLTAASQLIWAIIFNIKSNMMNIAFAVLIWLCGVQGAILFFAKKPDPSTSRKLLYTLVVMTVFYFATLHEFFVSGVQYRIFWAQPFLTLITFTIIGYGILSLKKPIRILLYVAMLALLGIRIINFHDGIAQTKAKDQFFPHPRMDIYLNNPPQWVKCVTDTTKFLEMNLRPNETFFALPYDPLFYFLLDKNSPSRQLIFFEHINIPQEQERTIIQHLEQQGVRWIVLSSISRSPQPGMGVFGETYCPLLGKYLKDNFTQVAEFGDWANEPGWAWNYGTRVFKKTNQ